MTSVSKDLSENYFSGFKVVSQGQGQLPWVQSTRDRCETNGRVHVALQRSLDPRSESDRGPRTSPSESDKNKVVRVTKSGISRKRLGADEEKHVAQAARGMKTANTVKCSLLKRSSLPVATCLIRDN